MTACRYFEGKENIRPKSATEARKLIGKRVAYLQERDIDKSGRGYFFPQYGTVVAVAGREIAMNEPTNFVVRISDLVEMVLFEEKTDAEDQP